MSARVKNILYSLLAALLLVGFALAIPSGTLTQEARQRYLDSVDVVDEGEDELIIFLDE